MSIHRQNKDILFKDLSDHNNDVFLDILNIDDICDIGDIGDKNRSLIELPNEIAIIKSFNKKPDKLYLLGKKVIINLEFESSYKLENIARYMLYASLISYTYSAMSGYKISYPVRTIVVYPGNVKLPTSVYTNTESLHFSITQISLNDVIDGDAILADISKRFREDPNLVLSEKEMVKLV
ncbi:MAG: hypothetical protein LBT38_11105, partial [Deltaproteobacteria bacterium]|nr:hypothetical protein [Deltaproteobacteria bacterium]